MSPYPVPYLSLLPIISDTTQGNVLRSVIVNGHSRACRLRGFTLVELMVTLALAAMLAGLATPMAMRMYDSMQYRDALRSIGAASGSARYRAITSGRAMDFVVEPDANSYTVALPGTPFNEMELKSLDDKLRIELISAGELSNDTGVGVIRFYPDGSSSGGSVTVWQPGGQGVRLRVDWLLGRVTRESPDLP